MAQEPVVHQKIQDGQSRASQVTDTTSTAEGMPDQWGPGVGGQKPTAGITPKWVEGREDSQQVSLTGEKRQEEHPFLDG